MTLTPRMRIVAVGALLISAIAVRSGTVAAQESGGAAALTQLQARNAEKALAALGAVADQRSVLPEVETDIALPAAAGGVSRALAQEDADVRFDLLSKWTLPSSDRKSVRLLTAIVPQEAPPQVFARVIGERPRDSSFTVASVNGVQGLFSSGWMLVTAAEESGRLRKLITDLEPLVAQKIPGADSLLLLANIAAARADVEALKPKLTARADALKAAIPADGKYAGSVDANALVIAAAALKHAELRAISERMFDTLVESTLGGTSPRLRPFLRMSHATAIQLNRGESGPEVLRRNRLKYWIPVSGLTAASSTAGAVPATWLTHEDHILHLAGSGQDGLLFRYPLSGEFNFLCETQEGGNIGTDGGLAYGGLFFEALGVTSIMTVRDGDAAFPMQRPCPFVRHESRPVFNRVSIRTRPAADGKPAAAQFLANLHPMWTDELAGTSPWLGLRGVGEKRPVFRNLKLTGSPVIPREVKLTNGQQLRGWLAGFYGETQAAYHAGGSLSLPSGIISSTPGTPATPAPDAKPDAAPVPDWQIADGVVSAVKQASQPGRTWQSVLRYQRPLQDRESIAYEFEYRPGEVEVHPALGRLVLLMESGGVRIHWMTDGDREWSGLPEDNAALEPLSRRGGREVPLKAGEWNKVSLARADGKLKLSLNGTLIYERAIDFGGDLQFGLYRDRTKHAVKVRNVTLTGDWPEAVPAECLDNPTMVIDEPVKAADRKVSQSTFGEPTLADNATAVRATAARLATSEERFQFLSRWVLPGKDRDSFRMSGAFTPVDRPPRSILKVLGVDAPVIQRPLRTQAAQTPLNHPRDVDAGIENGNSEIVSPVFDLIDVAAQLGRLDALKTAIDALPQSDDQQSQRDRAALLGLIGLEQGDSTAANQATEKLFALLPKAVPTDLSEMWPETLLTWRTLTVFGSNEAIGELISAISQQRTQRALPAGFEFWHTQISSLQSRRDYIVKGGTNEQFDGPLETTAWMNAVRHRSRSNGSGNGASRWHVTAAHEVQHLTGHQEEFLLYRSPLAGSYEVTCELGGSGSTEFLAGGLFQGINANPAILNTGSFRLGTYQRKEVSPPFSKPDLWHLYRVSLHDRLLTVSLNGRVVRSERLPQHADPWLGLHAWYRNAARMRDLRISGHPVVLDEVVLSADPQMSSWLPYHEYSSGYDSAHWSYQKDPESTGIISGKQAVSVAGMGAESLLRYLRPLVEDGVIAYEFYYEPGKYETHPALDRLAFLLRPQGLKLHWITDEKFNATDVSPLNEIIAVPDTVKAIPLQPGQWNQLRLIVSGTTVSIEVNGQLAGSVDYNSLGIPRHGAFGLFHWTGESEVRVRNLVMRGDWPKSVPNLEQQELADPTVPRLDAERAKLTAVFSHKFTQSSPIPQLELEGIEQLLPSKYLQPKPSKGGLRIEQRPHGLELHQDALNGWTSFEINARFVLRGNFDVEAEFDDFTHTGDKDAAAMLVVKLNDENQTLCRAMRNSVESQKREVFHVSKSTMNADGTRAYQTKPVTMEATAGRLRLARRGSDVYYLFAEYDSPNFRVMGIERVSAAETVAGGVDLNVIANGTSSVGVVWKNLRIAAEELLILPDSNITPKNEIFVMNIDGSDLRSVTKDLPGDTGSGSPDWSPDGKQIAFDRYTGSSNSSHAYRINLDGSGLVDLGEGIMPTFGPDGKKLAFTWGGQGMALMDLDGKQREVLTPDGWGAQFSPDGKWVAYQSYERIENTNCPVITIIDIRTKQTRTVLDTAQARRYSQIYWNIEWSPDSRQICFKARLRNDSSRYESAITSIDDPEKGFRVLTTETTDNDFSWHPDGSRILFGKTSPKHGGMRLFVCDLKTGAIELLASQPMDMPNHSGIWSPDGKQIAFVSRPVLKPVPWKPDTASSVQNENRQE